MTTQVTKLINTQKNLNVQPVEKDTWHEVTIVKLKSNIGYLKIEANNRVGRQRALQIIAGEDESPR